MNICEQDSSYVSELKRMYNKYHTRTIITRGLYDLYPLFEVHLCTCDLWPYVWLVFKRGFYSRADYSGGARLS